MPLTTSVDVIRAISVFPQSVTDVESVHHLYPVEDGSECLFVLVCGSGFGRGPPKGRPREWGFGHPRRVLNESSSLLIVEAAVLPSESRQQR